jgi:hypothetical protein
MRYAKRLIRDVALTFGTTLVRAQYTSSAKLVYPFKVPLMIEQAGEAPKPKQQ